MKKFSLVVLCALLLPLFVACDDYEYHPRPGPRPPHYGPNPPYPPPPPGPRPPHDGGGWRRGGDCNRDGRHDHRDHRCGPRRGPRHSLVAENVFVNEAALLALDYGIEQKSADTILQLAKSQTRLAALEKLGLSQEEAAPLLRLEMPSDASIQHMASTMGEDAGVVKQILADFITDLKTE